MTNIWIGEKLSFGAAVWDFCGGQQNNGIYIHEVVVKSAPEVKQSECQIISGIGVTFKLVGLTGTSECANCTDIGKLYFEIGATTTDSSGRAYINEPIISNDYLSAYLDSVSLGYSLRIIACITDSKGQTVINDKCSEPITVTEEYTETLRIFIRPWGWYTPQGAADEIAKKLVEINAALFEIITFDKTGYSYVKTDITVEGEDVILNIRIRRSPVQTMAVQLGWAGWVAVAVGSLMIIVAIIGLTWKADRVYDTTVKSSDPVPPNQQEPVVERTITDWNSKCSTAVPNNPTCADISSYALCLDVGHIATDGTLTSVYPNFEPFSVTYAKYNGLWTKMAAECNQNVPGKTPAEIKKEMDKKVDEYKQETESNYKELQKKYEKEHNCWIANPWDGCLLSSSVGTTIVGTLVLVAVMGGVYWAITRRPAQTRIAIETAGRYTKAAAKAAGKEISRARAGYAELTSKQTAPTITTTGT